MVSKIKYSMLTQLCMKLWKNDVQSSTLVLVCVTNHSVIVVFSARSVSCWAGLVVSGKLSLSID